jgi:hypothetical protein
LNIPARLKHGKLISEVVYGILCAACGHIIQNIGEVFSLKLTNKNIKEVLVSTAA